MTMTPQERDVIAGIFDRLRQAENQPREPEAERFIAERLREQPYAPYAMAQAIYVQETALANMQEQIEALQAQIRELQARPAPASAPAPAQSGGFLSGIFGGGQPEQARPRSVPSFPQRDAQPASPVWNTGRPDAGQAAQGPAGAQASPQPSPWANQAAQPPGRAGGGFMASALSTAAGVAGGMMLGNVLANAFGGQKAGAAAETAKASEANATDTNADSAAQTQSASDNTSYDDGSSNPANYQDASYDEGYDDGSSFGGDDDWA
jgi:hypothetical protein